MSHITPRTITQLALATFGACAFWSALGTLPQRPSEPHPGLSDAALQKALQKDHSKTHRELSYVQARRALFSHVDGDSRKTRCAYTNQEIKYVIHPLPNLAAVEHAWPLTRLPAPARADLHHMMGVTPEARVARVNLHYGNVLVPVWQDGGSKAGPSNRVVPVFEVRKEMRGDVARSMFYIATMYGLDIPDHEERTLRAWHEEDPVSAQERARDERVAAQQRSSNPFVTHPKLVQRIKNF